MAVEENEKQLFPGRNEVSLYVDSPPFRSTESRVDDSTSSAFGSYAMYLEEFFGIRRVANIPRRRSQSESLWEIFPRQNISPLSFHSRCPDSITRHSNDTQFAISICMVIRARPIHDRPRSSASNCKLISALMKSRPNRYYL